MDSKVIMINTVQIRDWLQQPVPFSKFLMTTKQLFLALFSATLIFTSCQKNGELQTTIKYSEINIRWNYNPYPDKPFSVVVDGETVADTLMFAPGNYRIGNKRILGEKNPKQLVLKDLETGKIVLDTMVNIIGYTAIRLQALSATDKPAFVGEEIVPEDPASRDSAKYSFIYNDVKLPDSVILKMYIGDINMFPMYDEPAVAILVLKRNEFSAYASIPFHTYQTPVHYFELYDAKTQDLIQGIDGNNFTGYAYGISQGNTSAPTTYKFTKVLIRFADPDETNEFRINRFYDLILNQVSW